MIKSLLEFELGSYQSNLNMRSPSGFNRCDHVTNQIDIPVNFLYAVFKCFCVKPVKIFLTAHLTYFFHGFNIC